MIVPSYMPAFFLQKLVAFLEEPASDDPSVPKQSFAWGYVFCLGLLVSFLLEAIVGGQLWLSKSAIATRASHSND